MTKKVSVIIPCYNEKNYIEKCINSILLQNYPYTEIIVCDGGSNDGTLDILNTYENKIILINNPHKTTPYALNLGIKKSTGDIIIIFGAHAVMHKNYIIECIKTFEISEEIACVGGVILNINENHIARHISAAMSSLFGVGNAHFRTGLKSGYVDTVAFGAYKKEVFQKIGYFDEELTRNQDDEFNFRLLKNGYNIYLNPAIKSDYHVRASYKKLFRQYRQYGYWKVYVNKKHKTITTIRQLFPALFVAYILSGSIFTFIFPSMLFIFTIPIVLYITMSIIFAALKAGINITHLAGIIFSFWILHFSYGYGYIHGLIDFYILNKKNIHQSYSNISR